MRDSADESLIGFYSWTSLDQNRVIRWRNRWTNDSGSSSALSNVNWRRVWLCFLRFNGYNYRVVFSRNQFHNKSNVMCEVYSVSQNNTLDF